MEISGEQATAKDLGGLALYNYGHFTSMRVEGGRVRGLSLHLERLVRDCRILFDTELDPDHVRGLLRRAVASAPSPITARVTVFDPGLELGNPGASVEAQLLVTTRPAATGALPPLRLASTRYQRDLPHVKHVGLFATVHHRRLAQREGYDDVLFLDEASRVVEGATWNIGFLVGDQLVWPQGDCLPGVTMHLVTVLAAELGIRCTSGPVGSAELARMRSAFITNASVGLRAVGSVEEVTFDPDEPLIKRLQDAYMGSAGEVV